MHNTKEDKGPGAECSYLSLEQLQNNICRYIQHKGINQIITTADNNASSVDIEREDWKTLKSFLHPASRLSIYTNCITQRLLDALDITYPGVWHLLGRDIARSLSGALIPWDLPTDTDFGIWGANFPQLLLEACQNTDLEYISEFAAYEWQKYLCYMAPSHKPLTAMSEIKKSKQYARKHFTYSLAPSIKLFQSRYDIKKINEDIQTNAAVSHQANGIMSATWGFVAKLNNIVSTYYIDQHTFKNLSDLIAKNSQSRVDIDHNNQVVIAKLAELNLLCLQLR